MGKLLNILVILWLVGMVVCLFKAVYWNEVSDDLIVEWLEVSPDDRRWTDEDTFERQEAARKATNWTTGTILWGAIGAVILVLVWRWEGDQDEPAEGWVE